MSYDDFIFFIYISLFSSCLKLLHAIDVVIPYNLPICTSYGHFHARGKQILDGDLAQNLYHLIGYFY